MTILLLNPFQVDIIRQGEVKEAKLISKDLHRKLLVVPFRSTSKTSKLLVVQM